jgi:single-strand selective monofunctional uracil DNA glycosylase
LDCGIFKVVDQVESGTAESLMRAARRLVCALDDLCFAAPVSHVYSPLTYAWSCYEAYVRKFANNPKRVIFLGMNPGPFGMVQTGIPFGEIAAVRDWLRIEGQLIHPERQHSRRPILGFACPRSEVSGRRLWGLFAQRFQTPQRFFAEHLVMNYCPLAFLESSGRNRTPDKLSPREKAALFAVCDEHLLEVVSALQPEWLIGIGDFAFRRARGIVPTKPLQLGQVLHPSPASPAANRDWARAASRQLENLGVW